MVGLVGVVNMYINNTLLPRRRSVVESYSFFQMVEVAPMEQEGSLELVPNLLESCSCGARLSLGR